MLTTRAVWILDCSVFVELLDDFLQEHVALFPWLKDCPQVDRTWNWQNFQQGRKSIRDELIDWIIKELMCEYRYMDVHLHLKNNLFCILYDKVRNKHDLAHYFNQYLPIPVVYPELPVTYVVTRSCGTLFVQFETEPLIKRIVPRY